MNQRFRFIAPGHSTAWIDHQCTGISINGSIEIVQAGACVAKTIPGVKTASIDFERFFIGLPGFFRMVHIQLRIGLTIPGRNIRWINRQCSFKVDQRLLIALEPI